MRALGCSLLLWCGLCVLADSAFAQPIRPALYQDMRWRMIGPFRGGRTVGATGIANEPNVFYIGVNNGGVWKSIDYGRTWQPVFDSQPTGSVGTVAVAPANPSVVYAGSGEGLHRPDLSTGDGVYRSADAGKTWTHLGLRDGQQIPAIIVDPQDANRLFVAVLGHPYGPNTERGVFRSTDGGKKFKKVLYKDENTGAVALAFDPSNAQTVYAVLWESREGPWENAEWEGKNSGLYKSTDGGTTWKRLTRGLPTAADHLGRIGFDVSRSDPNRLYAMVDAPRLGGVYRSDDAGESWVRVNNERRIWGRGFDFAEIKVDPKNKDVAYVCNTSFYRSDDAGKNWTCVKGSPGGDDYHTIWINPDNTNILLLVGDQGASVSVDHGRTWSTWYNQPTAQFYHVITDNQFPYWVYGGQQESGSAGVASRGRDGEITFRDWHPVGVEEYGYVAPDPLHPNLIYGGKVTRFDSNTGQVQRVGPQRGRGGRYRFLRTAPLLFSPVDPHVLFLGGNVLFKTTDGGEHWEVISPDLSRKSFEVPANVGSFRTPAMDHMPRRGVIYTVAPSYKDANTIWAGTDDGLIHLTQDDGKTWHDVTPKALTPWSKVSVMDAGRFDALTAYAAINRIRLDDQKPHIYRTHDAGKSWQEISTGLPDGPVNAVREDPIRPGLLFCGTEQATFVSFDDGDHWQSLRLNMPATSIRDLVVHDDDLVVGTHGRSFWILDDITPLRQIHAKLAEAAAYLFQPQPAYRVRWNVNTDTPLPSEEPAGENPPDGAILNYYLKEKPVGPVVLEIDDAAGKLVRRYSSADKPRPVNPKELTIATYWARPPQPVGIGAGMHRFVWDLHYPPPEGMRRSYPMTAIYHNTPAMPQGPWAQPGTYTVKLIVAGQTYTAPLTVKMDPRVHTPKAALARQFSVAMGCYEGMQKASAALQEIRKLRATLKKLRGQAKNGDLAESLTSLDRRASALAGAPGGRDTMMMMMFGVNPTGEPSLTLIRFRLLGAMMSVEEADANPTPQAVDSAKDAQQQLQVILKRWADLNDHDVKTLNERLQQAKLPTVGAR